MSFGTDKKSALLKKGYHIEIHRVHWLAEQGLAPKRAFLAGISLLIFIVTEIVKNKRKGKIPMKKNAIDVLNVAANVINNLSVNLAGGALLANVPYANYDCDIDISF